MSPGRGSPAVAVEDNVTAVIAAVGVRVDDLDRGTKATISITRGVPGEDRGDFCAFAERCRAKFWLSTLPTMIRVIVRLLDEPFVPCSRI